MTTANKIGIMLDLETLDTGPRSIITQVGIVAFPLDDPETEMRRIDQYLPVQPQVQLKRTFSFATMLWWMEQEEKAVARLRESTGNDMEECLALVRSIHRKLSDLIASVGQSNIELWARGAQFDVVNLESLFNDCGLDAPWAYNTVMDLRTLMRLAGVRSEDVDSSGIVAHIATEDCRFQIRCYAEAMRRLHARA